MMRQQQVRWLQDFYPWKRWDEEQYKYRRPKMKATTSEQDTGSRQEKDKKQKSLYVGYVLASVMIGALFFYMWEYFILEY